MQLGLFSQRWRDRWESYRPVGEPINPRLYEVAELAGDREAKEHSGTALSIGARFNVRRVLILRSALRGHLAVRKAQCSLVSPAGFIPPRKNCGNVGECLAGGREVLSSARCCPW